MRGIVILLIVVCVVLVYIAHFTLMGLPRDYLPQVYNLLTGVDGEPQTVPIPDFVNTTKHFDEDVCRSFGTLSI